jgi:3-oxoacyl-[acyl-carrier-protein] synthase-3
LVVEAGSPSAQTSLLASELRTDGQGGCHLTLGMQTVEKSLTAGIPVGQYQVQPLTMNGREVYKFAVTAVPEVVEKVLFRAGLTSDQVTGYFIHQANQRILDAVSERLGIPKERVASVLEHYGNTSGGSVAIALDDWVQRGQLRPGDLGIMAGFGAGLTWGSLAFRWGRTEVVA